MRIGIAALGLVLASAASLPSAQRYEGSPPTYEIVLKEATIAMTGGVRLAADLFMPSGGQPGERFSRDFQ